MPLSISIPNRLAQLARILTALDDAQRVSWADRRGGRDSPVPPEGPRLDLRAGLDGLSLSRRGLEPSPPTDELARLSLSRTEPSPTGAEALNDRSLLLWPPDRPADVSDPFGG